MRRAVATVAVVWSAWTAFEQMAVGVIGLPGPPQLRITCHFRRQCHPDRPLGLPEWRNKEVPWKPEK